MNITRASAALAAAAIIFLPMAAQAQHEGHEMPAAVSNTTSASEITGTVLCIEGPPLPGAIVQVFDGMDATAKLKASALTDETGRFRLRLPAGMFHLRISYLGHTNYEKHLMIDAGAPAAIGVIRMEISAVEVQEIVATAEKDRVRIASGATVFDVKRAGTAAGGSVADALRNVPGVEIDADGKISMRSGSVQVLLNGRRTALKDDALVAFLKQMPASALQRIESSTNASAAQEADGSAGLINLVFANTATETSGAYALSASAATAQQYMAAASATGSLGNALSWEGSYAFSTMQPQTLSHTMRDNLLAPDSIRTNHQLSIAHATHRLHSLNGGLTLRTSENSSLAGQLAWSWMRGAFDNRTDFADLSSAGVRRDEAVTASTLEHTIPTTEASLRWQAHGQGEGAFRFTSELRSANGTERFNGIYARPASAPFLMTDMSSRRAEYAFQNDVTFRVGSTRLSLGEKTAWRTVDAAYLAVRDGVEDRDAFTHSQTVNAAYASAVQKVGVAAVEAGVRAEQAHTAISMSHQQSQSGDSFQLFPSLMVSWPGTPESVNRYHASYGRRIERPGAAALNPYSMGEDDMNSFIGNPLLRPELADQFEFGIEHHGAGATIVATPFIKLSRDVIRPIKAVTESGRSTTTLENVAHARSAGADISLRSKLTPHVDAMLSSSAYYLSTSGAGTANSGVYFNVRASLDVRLSPATTAQLYAYRRSAQPVEQGEILPALNSDFALTQKLGTSGRGLLTLRVSDPLNTNKLVFRLNDPTFSQQSDRKVTSRAASLFFSWSVGGQPHDHELQPKEEKPQIF